METTVVLLQTKQNILTEYRIRIFIVNSELTFFLT